MTDNDEIMQNDFESSFDVAAQKPYAEPNDIQELAIAYLAFEKVLLGKFSKYMYEYDRNNCRELIREKLAEMLDESEIDYDHFSENFTNCLSSEEYLIEQRARYAKANASLLSAAPDMYEAAFALMPLLSIIDLWDDLPYPDVAKKRIEALSAALNKTRGKQ